MPSEPPQPKCLNILSWRAAVPEELGAFLKSRQPPSQAKRRPKNRRSSTLAIRTRLAPVDIYCYLKARFGEPNGFQTFLRKEETSDNWIHWDFLLKAADQDVY